jgi:hypothetical protein
MLGSIDWYWFTLIFIVLISLWYLICGIRSSYFSKFTFYYWTGFIQGIPIFIAAILFLLFPYSGVGPFFICYILSRVGKVLETHQEDKMLIADLSKWNNWLSFKRKQSLISKLFL